MKLTEDDLSGQTEVRVHLDVWLKRYEWVEILSNQEKAEKWDEELELRGMHGSGKSGASLQEENKQLKTKYENCNDDRMILTNQCKELKEIVERLEDRYNQFGKLLIRDMTIPSWTPGQVCSLLESIHGNLTTEGK